jgi:hypothetical protein
MDNAHRQAKRAALQEEPNAIHLASELYWQQPGLDRCLLTNSCPACPFYFFLFWRASALSNPTLISRMTQTSATATSRICPTEQGIVPPQNSRVACRLLRCHYRRSASQAMGNLSVKTGSRHLSGSVAHRIAADRRECACVLQLVAHLSVGIRANSTLY